MAKRKRNIQILFCVSPEEKKLIRRKMIESKTKTWELTVYCSYSVFGNLYEIFKICPVCYP